MRVQKFGGTSVGSPQRMHALIPLISGHEQKIVVLSAVSGTTNNLDKISERLFKKETDTAKSLIEELCNKYFLFVEELFGTQAFKDKGNELIKATRSFLLNFLTDAFGSIEEKAILAQGELLSTTLFYYLLCEKEINASLLPALDFMRIDEDGEPDYIKIENSLTELLAKQKSHNLFITQGYICRNAFGEIDNLKRGGSDYTASIIGACVMVDEIQIWTDIDGMHNNDPRVVNKTFPIQMLSFDEAAELAYFGAKILHPTCILPAQNKNIPVRLLNTMKPKAEGTLISNQSTGSGVKAIAAKDGIISIRIKSSRMLLAYGFLRRVFEIFERYRKPIDLITTSEVAVSLTVDDDLNLETIESELKRFCSVEIEKNKTIVSLVGDGLYNESGQASKIFNCIKDTPVLMISCGGSRNNVSFLIETQHKNKVLQELNSGIFNL